MANKRRIAAPKAFASTITERSGGGKRNKKMKNHDQQQQISTNKKGEDDYGDFEDLEVNHRPDEFDIVNELEGEGEGEEEEEFVEREDDEEIDEDGAFNDEDDDRYGEFFEGLKSSVPGLEEFSDYENDPDAVDISTLLDGDDDDNSKSKSKLKAFFASSSSPSSPTNGSKKESDDEGDKGEEEDPDFARLLTKEPLSNKRRRVFRTESMPEGSFNIPASHLTSNPKMINFETLLGTISDNALVSELKKFERKAERNVSAAPLPVLQQEKIKREVAYQKSAEEVSKWLPLVQKNRQAEFLKVPVETTSQAPGNIYGLATNFKLNISDASAASDGNGQSGVGSMEERISQILCSAGVASEKDIAKAEELALKKVDPKLVKAQQAELQKMRSLLFYSELKQKRAAKIKSKKYRKIRRKEREASKNAGDQVEDAEEVDVVEMERRRAEERMTLKHANSKSKFKFNHMNEEGRDAVLEKVKRHELLMQKIKGDDEEDEDENLSDAEREEKVHEILSDLKSFDVEKESKGVLGMKFMQKAMEKKRLAAIEDIEREFGSSDEDLDAANVDANKGNVVCNNEGRIAFGSSLQKSAKKASSSVELVDPRDEKINENYFNNEDGDEGSDEGDLNPWLGNSSTIQKSALKVSAKHALSKSDHARAQKLESKLQKKLASVESGANDNAIVTIISNNDNNDTLNNAADVSGSREISFDSQRELIELAFADDDVIREFERDKKQIMSKDAPKEVNVTLPGWGSWSNQKSRRQYVKKIEGLDPRLRKDYKMKHVIINEAKDRKFVEKYQVSKLPFPHKSPSSYEAVMSAPCGREWNTEQTFQRAVKPRVSTAVGKIIVTPKLKK